MTNDKAITILQSIKAGTADAFIRKAVIKDALDLAISALEKQEAIKSCTPPSDDWEHYADRLHDIAYQSGYEAGKRDAEQDRWIPVTERLPEEYGEYRITWKTSSDLGKRFIGDAEYEPGFDWDDDHDRFKGEWLLEDYIKAYPGVEVIAWKPIGEPYTEEDNDKP